MDAYRLLGIAVFLLLMLSCGEEKTEKVDMPPSLATQVEKLKDTQRVQSVDQVYSNIQDIVDTSSAKKEKIAGWYTHLSDALKEQENWELSSLALIESIRYNPTKENAPAHLIEMAQNLHLKEERLPISKAAYQAIVEYYPESDQVKEAEQNIAEDQPSLFSQVQDLEDKLMRQSRDSMFINEMAAKDYITAVQLLAAIESDHEEVPTLLNRAAAMAKGLGQNKQAIRLYDWVIDEYQEQTEGKKALFYKGFTLDEEMEEYDRAEKAYTTFLEKYPDDQLASQVKILKSQLGKSDDEILEELKQKKANQ